MSPCTSLHQFIHTDIKLLSQKYSHTVTQSHTHSHTHTLRKTHTIQRDRMRHLSHIESTHHQSDTDPDSQTHTQTNERARGREREREEKSSPPDSPQNGSYGPPFQDGSYGPLGTHIDELFSSFV